MRHAVAAAALLQAALLAFAGTACADPASGRVLFTIRVENTAGGRVQVNMERSSGWITVGRVMEPASQSVTTFAASAFVKASTVAATAVHGIRIRVPASRKEPAPAGISIQPREFWTMPSGYGGHIPGKSAINTDIPSGTAIFRQFAPLVGDQVLLERPSGPEPLPDNWEPAEGDVILIPSKEPTPLVTQLVFENHSGGAVTATYDNGRTERIGTVKHILRGTGRFDGTSYTGAGVLNTNHGGVITVSTAPNSRPTDEGLPPEARGGFEIQPSQHAQTQPEMPQAMVVAPVDSAETLEGASPLFSGMLNLGDGSSVVDIRTDSEDWQPLPAVLGKIDDAFTPEGLPKAAPSVKGASSGVTAIRIRRTPRDLRQMAQILDGIRRSGTFAELDKQGGLQVEWQLRPPYPSGANYVIFSTEGKTLAVTNVRPFRLVTDLPGVKTNLSAELTAMDGKVLQKRNARVVVASGKITLTELPVR